jgi:hypothetical protein
VIAAAAPSADELALHLAEEARLYADLLELGQRERAAVVGPDPAALNGIVAEKERLIAAVGRAEAGRQAWLGAWASASGHELASLTLAAVMRALPPADAARVAPMRDLLLARVRDVAQMNHENGQLVGGALRIVTGALDAFARVRGEISYQPTGQRTQGSGTAVLDFRA